MSIVNDLIELNDNKSDIQDALVAKGVTLAAGHGFNKFAADIASITNQYTAGDEGKVVSGGELVAQTDYGTVTENGTYDTTNNNSITVDVASLPTSISISNALTRVSSNISNSDIYLLNMEDKTYLIGWIYISTNYPTTSIILSYGSNFTPTHYTNYTQSTYLIYTDTTTTSVNYARCNQQIDLSNRTVSFDLPMPIGKYYISAIFC